MTISANSEEQRHAEMNRDAQEFFTRQMKAIPPADMEQIAAYACQAVDTVVRAVLAKRKPIKANAKKNDLEIVYHQSYEFFFTVDEEQLGFFVDCKMEFAGNGEMKAISLSPNYPPSFCHA